LTASPSPIDAAAGGAGIRLRVKVVPGGSRDALAGRHGDRLRVKVAAPPEDGRANDAVVDLIARRLGVARRQVTIVSGRRTPLKTIQVRGVDAARARAALDPEVAP
jgi:uncharacterized protein (TIGR00251 family)